MTKNFTRRHWQPALIHTFIVLVFSGILFSCQSKTSVDTTTEKELSNLNDSLTQELQNAYNKDAVVGFAVAVVNEQGEVYSRGFGYSDVQKEQPYTSETVQNIASISKTLLGISLLKAQEMGMLNLKDPINQYLPFKIINPYHPDEPIRIEHLAYHTSSILDLDEVYGRSYVLTKNQKDSTEGEYDWFGQPETKISLTEFIENSLIEGGIWYQKESFANTVPGEVREYSNIGAALCALVLEGATGQSYTSFTREYILNPLQMEASGWLSRDIDTTTRSKLYIDKETIIPEYSLITYPDGGFITSSADLSRFLSELIKGYKGNGTLLNPKSYKQLFHKHELPSSESDEEFGIFMDYAKKFIGVEAHMIGHDGGDPGILTAMYFDPDTGWGRILLVNTDSDYNEAYWPQVQSIWKSLLNYEVSAAGSLKSLTTE